MEANEVKLLDLLERTIQLQVPVYQRAYDWSKQNWQQLYDDILRVGRERKHHFMGAITLMPKDTNPASVPKHQIIDGQQRITSVMILLKALRFASISDTNKVRIDRIFFNTNERDDPERHKLVLGDDDDPTFKKITGDTQTEASGNTLSSFAYFKDRLSKDGDPDLIWNGLQGLKVASLNLGTDDDAQAIFESMNSTGLDLSTTDLVRNYMLMGGDLKKQEKMYRELLAAYGKNV